MAGGKESAVSITKRERNGVAILDLRGKLTGTVGSKGSLPEVVLRLL